MKQKNSKLLAVDKDVRPTDIAIINEVEEINDKADKTAKNIASLEVNIIKKIDDIKIPVPEKVVIPAPIDYTPALQTILEEVKKNEEITDLQISPELKAELKGEKGADGISPDPEIIVKSVLKKIPKPKDGKTPVKGVDYFDGLNGSPDTAQEIAEKLNTLEKQVDWKVLKNVPEFSKSGKQVIHRGGSRTFTDLSDTPDFYTGSASKGVRVNAGETALEFYTVVDTDEKAKVSANDTTAGFLDSKITVSGGLTKSITSPGGNEVLNIEGPDLSGYVPNGPITDGDLTMSTNRMLGRTTASTGAIEEITVGTGLSLSGGNLSATSSSVNSYISQAFTAQTSVNVVHTLGVFPVVQIVDNTGAVIIPLSIVNNTVNDFTVTFTSSTTGKILATVGSPQPNSYIAVTSTYPITTSDYTINCTANSFTVTLPTAVGSTGRLYNIKNSGSGTITVATTSSQTIDGGVSGSVTLSQYDNLTVQSDGSNWIII